MRHQLCTLVLGPVSAVRNQFLSQIIMVVDALDECEEDDAVSRIIQLLVKELREPGLLLKSFVTSQPEYYLRTSWGRSRIPVIQADLM